MQLDPRPTHWNDLAKDYDNVMSNVPQMRDLFAEIVRNLPDTAAQILDLGAGTGNLLAQLRARFPQADLIALDPASAMLDRLREKTVGDSQITCLIGSAHAIDLPDNSVDAVVSNYALHHLTHLEKKFCAKEVMRVLKPGGRFVYGDQHCRQMGGPHDLQWVEEMFSLLSAKALHYLRTAGLNRMLLQIELMPKFLLADGEMPVPVSYWLECLKEAGFLPPNVIAMEPAELLNRVIVATKPAAQCAIR
jgi:ubiquinone/menaquinone biosynthesis C-methylase UbiE